MLHEEGIGVVGLQEKKKQETHRAIGASIPINFTYRNKDKRKQRAKFTRDDTGVFHLLKNITILPPLIMKNNDRHLPPMVSFTFPHRRSGCHTGSASAFITVKVLPDRVTVRYRAKQIYTSTHRNRKGKMTSKSVLEGQRGGGGSTKVKSLIFTRTRTFSTAQRQSFAATANTTAATTATS